MKILEKEVALREETRGVQQARPQLDPAEYLEDAASLAGTQQELAGRAKEVVKAIGGLENASSFKKEIAQIINAAVAMRDAVNILTEPDTGALAMAAETEAIEWLLKAKRSKGGGSGVGNTPGEGQRQGKDMAGSALALLGEADEAETQVLQREVHQATGKSGKEVAEEFRYGLDKYFENLETNL